MDPDNARGPLETARVEATELIDQMSARLASVVDATAEATADDEHDPEGSTLAFERGQLVAQIERSRVKVVEIDIALERIALGTYGICERCGAQIGPARLEVLPAARLCITCANARDQSRHW
jgi:DnaK suppressor protein